MSNSALSAGVLVVGLFWAGCESYAPEERTNETTLSLKVDGELRFEGDQMSPRAEWRTNEVVDCTPSWSVSASVDGFGMAFWLPGFVPGDQAPLQNPSLASGLAIAWQQDDKLYGARGGTLELTTLGADELAFSLTSGEVCELDEFGDDAPGPCGDFTVAEVAVVFDERLGLVQECGAGSSADEEFGWCTGGALVPCEMTP